MINLKDFGLTRAQALCALYRHASCFGMGQLHYRPGDLSEERAEKILAQQTYFDYVGGRVLKVDLSEDIFEERLYDRDNGSGSAEWALLEYATDPKRLAS